MTYIIFVVVFVGVIAAVFYDGSKTNEAWQEAAERLGLDFTDGGWLDATTITGRLRGIPVEVTSVNRGSRKRSKIYTVTSVELRPACLKYITVSEHSLSDTIGTFFGGDDKEIGDESFDSDFRITGELNEQSRRCLQHTKVQKVIRDLAQTYEYFKIEKGTLKFEKRQRKPTPSEVVLRINRAVDAAEIINDVLDSDSRDTTEEASTQQGQSSESLFPDPDSGNDIDEPRQRSKPRPEPESSEVW